MRLSRRAFMRAGAVVSLVAANGMALPVPRYGISLHWGFRHISDRSANGA